MKLLEGLLNEISASEAYDKYYKNLFDTNPETDKNIYNKLVYIDPTTSDDGNRIGAYTKWFFDKKNIDILKKMSDDELGNLKNNLIKFNRIKNSDILTSEQKDLNKFEINGFLNMMSSLGDDVMTKTQKDKEIKKDAKKYEVGGWIIIVPETEEASCKYGKGTTWCTTSTEANNLFNEYKSQGDLYILIDKRYPDEKYQLHPVTGELKDAQNSDVQVNRFFNADSDLYDFLDNLIPGGLDFSMVLDDINNGDYYNLSEYNLNNLSVEQKKKLINRAFYQDQRNNNNNMLLSLNTIYYVSYPGLTDDYNEKIVSIFSDMLNYPGEYDLSDQDDLFSELNGILNMLGGYDKINVDKLLNDVTFETPEIYERVLDYFRSINKTEDLMTYLDDNDYDIKGFEETLNTLMNLRRTFKYDKRDNSYSSKLARVLISNVHENGNVDLFVMKNNIGNNANKSFSVRNVEPSKIADYLVSDQLLEAVNKMKTLINNPLFN
jgi:hypothetical protein